MSSAELGHKFLKVNEKSDLIELFDEDHNGGNGDEYLMDEAKDSGFETNAEYWIDEAFGKKKITRKGLDWLIDTAFQDDAYGEVEYEIAKFDSTWVISVAFLYYW